MRWVKHVGSTEPGDVIVSGCLLDAQKIVLWIKDGLFRTMGDFLWKRLEYPLVI